MNNEHVAVDQNGRGLSTEEIERCVATSLSETSLSEASLPKGGVKRVLFIPPDVTRAFSGARAVLQAYANLLGQSCRLDILPALGTHVPLTDEEIEKFYPIHEARFLVHNWRNEVIKIGSIPEKTVREISEGLF